MVSCRRSKLQAIETAGNKLPHPLMIFFWFGIIFLILSRVGSMLGWSATGLVMDSATGEATETTVQVQNLLNRAGFAAMLNNFNSNFLGFAPLAIYLVISAGLVCAEDSGYLASLMRRLMRVMPASLLTPGVVFLGVMSNIGSVVGYVVIPPLAAVMFKYRGRHPLAGLCAAFAGAAGGFSANLLIGPIDPLVSGISTMCAQIIDPNYTVLPTSNWYVMMASTLALTLAGTWVTDKVVEPRLNRNSTVVATNTSVEELSLSPQEKKALRWANLSLLLLVVLAVVLAIPQNSFLRNANSGSLLSGSPLMNGIIPIISFIFFVPSVIYGRMTGVFKNAKDVCESIVKSQGTCAFILATALIFAQGLAIFDSSNIGTVLAMKGASLLSSANLWPPLLCICFTLITAVVNLLIPSASTKLLLLGPIFIPMFMLLGISPEMTQFAYRIGDSCMNIITPLNAYVVMLLASAKQYVDDCSLGTLISNMMPYSLAFLVMWCIVMVIWMLLGLPLGPGASIYL